MKTKRIFLQSLLIVLGLTFSGCGSRPEIIKIDPAYGAYISGYTSGMVTRKSNIRIELAESVPTNSEVEGALPDSTLLEDIFSFEPAVEGKAIWISDRVIEFVPFETLPANQFYTVDFDLERVAKVKDNYENFKFQFSTYQQTLFVETNGLTSYDDYYSEWQKLEGSIMTSDFEDTTKLRQVIHASQDGKPLKLTFSESYYDENKYYFTFDSVVRSEKASKVILTWDGSPLESMSRGKREIDVPALGDFQVLSTKVIDNEEQYV